MPASQPTEPAPPGVVPPDPRVLRRALGQFATGVTVITTLDRERQPVGLTANSFSALSLEPPLVLWSLREASPSLAAFDATGRFVVNVLTEAQVELSRRFASPAADKFAEVAFAANVDGIPLLHGAAAWFECRTVTRQAAGDHILFIAEIERFATSEQAPLVFHGGGYHALGSRL